MGRNLAISIGINKYEFSQPLKYAKRDAELMRDFLVKEAGFERVLFCSDESPNIKGKSTRASFVNLRRVLRTTFEKPFMEAGDNFWFFFSGHGMRHKGYDYLMACDSDPGDVSGTAISISYVTEQLRRCGADNVVLILDACRSQGGKSGQGIGYQAAQVSREKGVITIFSCSPDELSYEINDLQQGIFTKALLEGLGAQGRCATVERLNHYLNGRVPDLIRQYKKGDTSRQTPYMIAEPASKYHLILCPQYATKADVAPMKNDAFSAEIHKDFDLAEQLWIRVLAASPGGDMDAIKGLQRIAVAKIQPAAIPNQPSSKNSATTDKSPEAAPPNPTPIEHDVSPSCENSAATDKSPEAAPPNPTPIEHDVPLKSERGVDYTKLRDLLASRKWKEADQETANKMLEVAGRTEEGWLRVEDINLFPCEDLRTIDQLWVKYSNGRFGFSVQKRIYESLGGTREYDDKIWKAFGHRVGWRVNKERLYYKDLKFNTKAAEGHLPGGGGMVVWVAWGWGEWLLGVVVFLFSRVEPCNVAVDENETFSQSSSIISNSNSISVSAAKQSPQSLVFSPPTTVPLPTPIEPDVPLKSERGVDYTKLRDLLASGKWKEADEETMNKMLEAAGRKKDGSLRVEDIDRFPCEDLRTIDRLWVKYSKGRFGFSVQKRIYESLGGTREYDEKIWEAFGDLVCWRVNKKWMNLNDLQFNTKARREFNTKAPEGNLPWFGVGLLGGVWCSLAWRLVNCNI